MDRRLNGSTRSYSGSRTDSTMTFRQFSPSRRMFCLLTVFDFLFTLVAWLIYAHAFDKGLKLSLDKEVSDYKIKSSLFDIVLLSLWRMVVLLLVYALYHSRKWYAIAITTTISTGFIVAKVINYDFSERSHPMDYVMVIISLFLCWAETLFLDFKVFPAELKAEKRRLTESLETTAGERRPLLDENPSSYHTQTWLTEHSSFYTPYGSQPSSLASGDESDEDVNAELSPEDVTFKRKAKEIFGIAWGLLSANNEWKKEKDKDGITVESCVLQDTGKMFKVQCSIDAPPSVVFALIVLRVEDGPRWNTSVAESRVLHKIDSCTDICYNVTTDQAGGMVSSRDFVNLRHWQKRGKAYFSCNASVEYQHMPPVKEHVRGENHPGGWLFAEKEGHHDQTDFVMLVNTDLKGWLPQYLIDQAMTGVLFGTAECLRNYVHSQK